MQEMREPMITIHQPKLAKVLDGNFSPPARFLPMTFKQPFKVHFILVPANAEYPKPGEELIDMRREKWLKCHPTSAMNGEHEDGDIQSTLVASESIFWDSEGSLRNI